MRPERDRFAEHAPRLHAGRLDPRQPQPRQGRRALPVEAQSGLTSPRAKASSAAPICPKAIPPKRAPRASIASTRSSSASASASRPSAMEQRTNSARSWSTCHPIRPQPLHHRQRGAGVLGGGPGVAEVHRQVGEAGVELRRRPRPRVAADQRQCARGRLDRARGVADVLARVGGGTGAPAARRGRERSRAARAGAGTRPDPPGRTRAPSRPSRSAAESPPPGPSRASSSRTGSLRRSSVTIALISVITSAARAVSSSSGGPPVAHRVGDRARQGDHASMLAADRPEEPEHGEQLLDEAAVAVGERVAQLVGEVDLLGGDRIDRRATGRGRTGRRGGGRRRRSPRPAWPRAPRPPRRRRRAAGGRTRGPSSIR